MDRPGLLKYMLSWFSPVILERRKSPVSDTLEIALHRGALILDSARANYSFGGLHTVMRRAFDLSGVRKRNPKKVLVLGYGAGSVTSILVRESGLSPAITGVELDPEVIALSKKYFPVPAGTRLNLLTADAAEWIRLNREQFDLVVVDLFVDLEVPSKFQEEGFLQDLARAISPGGLLLYNLVVHQEKVRDKGAVLFRDLNRLCGTVEWLRIQANRTENWVFAVKKNPVGLRQTGS